ncbi:MAG: elongation factor P [Candidatus Bipolaricaulota bacterium]
MGLSVSELSKGLTVEYQGELYRITKYEHSKRGRGDAFARVKMKSFDTGKVLSKTFKGKEDIKKAYLDKRSLTFLYSSGDSYHFMDQTDYAQFEILEEKLGDKVKYLKDNLDVKGLFHEERLISIELPTFVELEITDTKPGVKGDTASGGEKPAKLQTGLEIKVPLFVKEGAKVKVDTREGKYVERV